jgi:hypothetical protein
VINKMKLQLKFSEVLQGEFSIKPLNLLLTFQINCPGCFLYSLPTAQKLFEINASDKLNIFALSTAFEDFELNTAENTRLLLRDKKVVGETRKALSIKGYTKYPQSLDFTVLMDELIDQRDFLNEESLEKMLSSNTVFENKNVQEADKLKTGIVNYLSRFEKIPYTFTVNQFAGTPTWVIFDEEQKILANWFGHKSFEETEWIIKQIKT